MRRLDQKESKYSRAGKKHCAIANRFNTDDRHRTENIHRYVDLTGYRQSKSGLCSKMPPTAILSIFLYNPMAELHCRPEVLVPITFLDFLCTDREVGSRNVIELVGAHKFV